jgi:hypothetical protein
MNTHPLARENARLRNQLEDAQATIRDLTMDGRDDALSLIGVAGLTVSQAKMAAAIARYGRITRDALHVLFYSMRVGDETPDPKIFNSLFYSICKKLKPHGIEFGKLYGVGYEMTPDNVARLRALAIPRVDSPPLAAIDQVAA